MERGNETSWLANILRNRWFQATSILGLILGIVGFFLGLPPISEIAFGKRVSLALEVVTQIPVFEVRQPVPGLSVQLNSQDLTQKNMDLVAARVRLRNNGEVSINPRNTAPNDPIGFKVLGGQVVRLYGRSATSTHLRKLAIPRQAGNTFVLPSGIIIDPGEFVQFDLLILRPTGKGVTFESVGKIEGLASIKVGRSEVSPPSPNASVAAWGGGFLTQFLRIITYPFIAIAILGGVVVVAFKVSSAIDRRKRAKRESFSADIDAEWDEKDAKLRKLVPAMYAAIGYTRLASMVDKELYDKRRASRQKRMEKLLPQAVSVKSDFEAGQFIEKTFSNDNITTWETRIALESLSLVNSPGGGSRRKPYKGCTALC